MPGISHYLAMFVDENTFVYHASFIINRARRERDFHSLFGISPATCSVAWHLALAEVDGVLPHHLLWALMFMKVYGNERTLLSLEGNPSPSAQTFWKYMWQVIEALADKVPDVVS